MFGIILNRLQGYSNKALVAGMLGLSVSLLLIGLIIWVVNRGNPQSPAPSDIDTITVATSIFPVYDIVRQIGGEAVEVKQILPSGASPHTFEVNPTTITNLDDSQVVFYIGNGLDDWSLSVADAAGIEQKIKLDQRIDLLEADHEAGEGEHAEEEGLDPHYWLSIPNAMLMGMQVKDSLVQIYPEQAELFEANYEDFAANMAKLDARLRERLNTIQNRNLVTYHSAWNYFARDYGFTVIAAFEPFPGEQPTPEFIRNFSQVITTNNVQTVYLEPQLSNQSLQAIANDLGVTLMQLDPIGGQPGRDSYQALMEYNVDQLIIGQQ